MAVGGDGRERRDFEFAAEDGTVLRAFLHVPASRPAPAIVMCNGFGGVRDQIDHFAKLFAQNGFTVLNYDHRGFGTSEGTPRFEVDPYRQLSDWRDALTVVEGLPEVSTSAGIGIWGTSFSGGLGLALAASDPRVSCVVAQIPNVSGQVNHRWMFDSTRRRRWRELMLQDRRARLGGAPPATLPVYATADGIECALPPVISQETLQRRTGLASSWRNEVTIRSVEHAMSFEPAGWAPHVSPTPLLMIIATDDEVTFPQLQLDLYKTLSEPKRLVLISGGHYDAYDTDFATTGKAALGWFVEYLASGRPDG